jgi:hypothetical protein
MIVSWPLRVSDAIQTGKRSGTEARVATCGPGAITTSSTRGFVGKPFAAQGKH